MFYSTESLFTLPAKDFCEYKQKETSNKNLKRPSPSDTIEKL